MAKLLHSVCFSAALLALAGAPLGAQVRTPGERPVRDRVPQPAVRPDARPALAPAAAPAAPSRPAAEAEGPRRRALAREGSVVDRIGARYAGETVTLPWYADRTPVTLPGGESVSVPDFRGARRDPQSGLPWYRAEIGANGRGRLTATLADAVWEPLDEAAQRDLRETDLPAAPRLRSFVQTAAKRHTGVVLLQPLRRDPATGRVQRLVSFRLETRQATRPEPPRPAARRAAENSVLASGTWFKLAVDADGIYRIDHDFLQGLGLDPGSIDPARLAVFGREAGMVPEDNDEPRTDDLAEYATLLVGGGDGSFDPGDALLFFGQAPDRPRFDGVRFRPEKHLYADRHFVFLTTDRGTGVRVGPSAEGPGPADVTVTAFDHVAFLEEDKENLLQSGREWYGDFFDAFSPTRNYSFAVPDRLVGEPLWIEGRFASRSALGTTRFRVRANGTQVLETNHDPITIGFEQLYASTRVANAEPIVGGAESLGLELTYTADASARGWLDYLVVNARRALRLPATGALVFRDRASVGEGLTAEYALANAAGATVWDVTDPIRPRRLDGTLAGGTLRFLARADSLRTFIAWRDADVRPATAIVSLGPVANQNWHNPPVAFPDYVIVSHPLFLDQARRLAAFHAGRGLDTLVVPTPGLYNEFGGGAADPSAIRDFLRMFYERATTDAELPRYLLLFGDASYDVKDVDFDATVNQDFVPSFQTVNSEHPIFSTNTDDFFGFLDPWEGGGNINLDTLGIDLGVGRLPVKSVTEAAAVVDKILHYASPASLGAWRNTVAFVADDEDGDLHRRQADAMAEELVADRYPVYNVDKIYLDAYQQVSASGGERYPAAREAINNRIFAGTLVLNFLGHGSEESWTKERVLGEVDIEQWTNLDRLALFITATCSFSRYDNPSKTSAGELTLLQPEGGAIALITTVRLVFSSANEDINRAVWGTIFERLPDGSRPALGDVIRIAKNALTQGSDISSGNNNRKFCLLGDPALPLAYPDHRVVTTAVNGRSPEGGVSDTLRALARVRVEGEVVDEAGNRLEGFNGVVSPSIFDKASLLQTLGNDPTSGVRTFRLQKNIVYRGNASVTNGRFSFEFIVPKDISYTLGKGKISYYAQAGDIDAHGFDTTVVIGGAADSAAADDLGPTVRVFLGDETFAFGGVTDENPTLLVKLEDASGINTVGNGIGHDITAVLNDADADAIVLNDFYEAALDDFTRGTATYRLTELEPGRYRVRASAWDVHNNPGEGYTEFVVASSAELALQQVLNYPNPFTTHTEFLFEHNRPGEPLQVMVEIFSVSGKRIKTLVRDVLTDGFRVDGITWDGRDDFGDTIGRGVYVYKVSVRSLSDPDLKASAFEKLVLLR